MLSFFGRGSAFSDCHNSAFFVSDKDLVLIDCPATSYQKVKKFDFSKFDNIYVLITHTHGDHAGGTGTFLQYLYFAEKKKLTVVAPSKEVYEDLTILLQKIEGCEPQWFDIITVNDLKKEWFIDAVPTIHSETLKNKCFGYVLKIADKNIIYTGDSAVIEPFEKYIKSNSILYSEISYYKSNVHMHYGYILPILKKYADNGLKVFVMHLDNEEELLKLLPDNIFPAPLFDETHSIF